MFFNDGNYLVLTKHNVMAGDGGVVKKLPFKEPDCWDEHETYERRHIRSEKGHRPLYKRRGQVVSHDCNISERCL